MIVLAFDQSTRITGWSLFKDGRYTDSGIINLAKITDTEDRSKQMGLKMCEKIDNVKPDVVIIENIQNQSNVSTVILLARLQGVVLGYCAAHNIRVEILAPSRWRAGLNYTQGPKVKREQLKQQSRDFVKNVLGLSIDSEDENEAIAINEAAHRIYGLEDEI